MHHECLQYDSSLMLERGLGLCEGSQAVWTQRSVEYQVTILERNCSTPGHPQ